MCPVLSSILCAPLTLSFLCLSTPSPARAACPLLPVPSLYALCPLNRESPYLVRGVGWTQAALRASASKLARDRQTESSEERRAGRFLYRPARSTRPKQGLREGGAAGRHLK